MSRPLDLSVYLVTDTALCGGPDGVVQTVSDAVAGGVTVVQLRDAHAPDDDFVAIGRRLVAALEGTGVPLIVNDRVHLVDAIGAQGAHVGQGDLPIAEARAILGPQRILGLSAASVERVRAAEEAMSQGRFSSPAHGDGNAPDKGIDILGSPREPGLLRLDYLGAGALRSTSVKPEAAPIGLAGVAAVAAASPWPVVAIGGVTAADAPALRAAGIAGMSVVSAICGRPDPTAAARELADAWEAARGPAAPANARAGADGGWTR